MTHPSGCVFLCAVLGVIASGSSKAANPSSELIFPWAIRGQVLVSAYLKMVVLVLQTCARSLPSCKEGGVKTDGVAFKRVFDATTKNTHLW